MKPKSVVIENMKKIQQCKVELNEQQDVKSALWKNSKGDVICKIKYTLDENEIHIGTYMNKDIISGDVMRFWESKKAKEHFDLLNIADAQKILNKLMN